MTDSDRLRKVIEDSKLSTNKFGKHIGLKTSQVLYDVLNDRNGISKDLAEKISAKCLEINTGWLLTGQGEMLKTENIMEQEELPEYDYSEFTGMASDIFTAKLLNMFKKGEIYPASVVDSQRELIQSLFLRVGKLEAIIEMMKGKSPEDLL